VETTAARPLAAQPRAAVPASSSQSGLAAASVGVQSEAALLSKVGVTRLQRAVGNQVVTAMIQRRLRVTAKLEAASPDAPLDKVRIGDRPKFWKATDDYFTANGRARANDEDYRHIVDFETAKRGWEKGLVGKKPDEAQQELDNGAQTLRARYPNTYVIPNYRAVGTKPLEAIRALEEMLKYVIKLEFNNPHNLWPGSSSSNRSSGSTSRVAKEKLKKLDVRSKHRHGALPGEQPDDLKLDNFMGRLDLDPSGTDTTHYQQVTAFRDAYQRGFSKTNKYGDAAALARHFWNAIYTPAWKAGYRDAQKGDVDLGSEDPAYLAGSTYTGAPKALPIMRLLDTSSRDGRVYRLRIQRLLSVAIRQKPAQNARKIAKMRISDRPDGFVTATEKHLGPRKARVDAYRHIIEFDVLKRNWKKSLKNATLKEANAKLLAGLKEAYGRLPRSYPRSTLPIRGRNDLEKVEELLKDVLTIEFNNPNNLWVGPSNANSSRGASGKAAKSNLKASDPLSKYEKVNKPLGSPQAAEDEQYRNFAMRLDLRPSDGPVVHLQKLASFEQFYAVAFKNTQRYGVAAVLGARFKAGWQRGYDARTGNTVNPNDGDPAYHNGVSAWEVDESEGYKLAMARHAPSHRMGDPSFRAGVSRMADDYKQGHTDASAHAVNAANTAGGYVMAVGEFKRAYSAKLNRQNPVGDSVAAQRGIKAAEVYFKGLMDGKQNVAKATLLSYGWFYDQGYAAGQKNVKPGTPVKPSVKQTPPGKATNPKGIVKKTTTGKALVKNKTNS
jgi:hypothetical protein